MLILDSTAYSRKPTQLKHSNFSFSSKADMAALRCQRPLLLQSLCAIISIFKVISWSKMAVCRKYKEGGAKATRVFLPVEAAPFSEISQKPHPMTSVCISWPILCARMIRNVTFELGTLLP